MGKLNINCNQDIQVKHLTIGKVRYVREVIINKDTFMYGTVGDSTQNKGEFIIIISLGDIELVFAERKTKEECTGILDNIVESILREDHDFINIIFSDEE